MSVRHRKYMTYGRNLLGFTHGDGAKEKDLPLLMATEAGAAWGATTHRYLHCHHVHHKIRKWYGPAAQQTEKDHIGVTVLSTSTLVDPARNVSVEYVRSPSPADGWHDRNGYVGSPQAVEAFLYDVRGGQPGRFTHEF